MVGASASAGFTEAEPLGGPTTPQLRLSGYVDAALLIAHGPVQNLAHAMFFVEPEAAGRYQIDQALKAEPTLVVGIDFLFWFCYGDGRTDQERLQRLEKGLKLLEAIPCLLVLGDIPDASAAANGILRADEIPSREAMAAANRRLKKWAAEHRHVILVSLSEFMRTALANRALTIHGHTLPEGKTRVLLQDDKLHPSPRGCAVLALLILDAVQSARSVQPAGEVRWDPKEVFELGSNHSPVPRGHAPKNGNPQAPPGK